MRKSFRKIIIPAFVILCVLMLSFVPFGSRPFKKLFADDIVFAKVKLAPPDIVLEVKDTKYLTECLNNTIIYKKDNSWRDSSGQAVKFTLFLKDGKEISVMPFGDYLIIDGQGYRCKYSETAELADFANELLEKKQDIALLENPPDMDVISDNTCISTDLGRYKWQRRASYFEEGLAETNSSEFDLSEYLNNQGEIPMLDTASFTGELRFKIQPDRISSLTAYDLESKEMAGTVEMTGNFFNIKDGKYLYEVKASWGEKDSTCKDAVYYFAINKVP